MKKAFPLLLFFLVLFSSAFAQNTFQTNNLATFCKVWGFLKYYHPYPSRKSVDWDTVLVNNYPKVKAAQTKEEFNRILLSITQKMGELKPVKHPFHPSDSEAINADFKWIEDTTVLSGQVCEYLQRVKKNHKPFKNKYIRAAFTKGSAKTIEKPYSKMVYPNEAYRFLSLARYWNIIDYYFPDKYLMDTNWNVSLQSAIPIFLRASDTDDYYRAIQWITARINDSHACTVKTPYESSFNFKYPPFAAYYNHDTLIISNISDSLSKIFNIKNEDNIIAINGKSIRELFKDIRDHHSASNESFLEYFYGYGFDLAQSEDDSSNFVIIRKGEQLSTWVKNYSGEELRVMNRFHYTKPKPVHPYKVLTDTLSGVQYGYINTSILKSKDVNTFLKQMKGIDYLIVDIRNYPSDDKAWQRLANRLISGKKYVEMVTAPNYKYPGFIKYNLNKTYDWLFKIKNTIGTSGNNYYKGRVIILVNHITMSDAEYEAMTLKLAPKAIVIGSQTAGADGNTSTVIFPGNYSDSFTGRGWFYLDGRQTQRIGIIPDIKVDYTLQSMLHYTDPIMQRALELIRTGK